MNIFAFYIVNIHALFLFILLLNEICMNKYVLFANGTYSETILYEFVLSALVVLGCNVLPITKLQNRVFMYLFLFVFFFFFFVSKLVLCDAIVANKHLLSIYMLNW